MSRLLAVALVLCVVLSAGTLFAKEKAPLPPPVEDVTLTGVISVVTDDDDNVTAVKLTVGTEKEKMVVYNITLDAKGKELGAMDEVKVEVVGVPSEKDGAKWITVKSFKKIVEEKPEE